MSSINFLPSSFFEAARRRRRRVWEVGAVMLALAGSVLGYSLLAQSVRDAQAELSAVSVASPGDRIDSNAKKELEQRKQTLVDSLNAYRDLASPVSATQILAALSSLQDSSIGLTELVIDGSPPTPKPKVDPKLEAKAKKTSRRGPAPTPAKTDFLTIHITGFGPDDAKVTEYVGRISQHALFTDVKLEFSRPIEAGDLIGRGFTISAKVALDCEYQSPSLKESVTDAN